jgi:peptidoglycan/LPS O-acetylase OafA/YrhL
MTGRSRIPELDAVRGLAAVGVVLFHAFPTVFSFGWSCVDLFFVLSGYLITTILLTQNWESGFLKKFYLRRICRIWPVYFLTLFALLVLNGLSTKGHPIDALPSHLLFLQNTSKYFGVPPAPFIRSFGPSWSVAIEEQYYLVWPLLILALGRKSVPLLAISLLLSCAAARSMFPGTINVLFTRGDGLAFGCFLAWLLWFGTRYPARIRPDRWVKFAGVFGGLFALVYVCTFWGEPEPKWQQFSFTGFSLLFFGLIGACVLYSGHWSLAAFRNPILRWFGTISYALYMFHQPIFNFSPAIFEKLGIESPWVVVPVTWSLILLLPTLSWQLVESPILSYQSRRSI